MSKKSTAKKTASPKTNTSNWHKEISASRGSGWRKAIIAGRQDSLLNPSTLRIARHSAGFGRQEDFAREVGLTKSTYCAIERGLRKVKVDVVKKIASKVKRPVSNLFKAHGNGQKFVAIIQKRAV